MTNNAVLQQIQAALRLTQVDIVRIFKCVDYPVDLLKIGGYFIASARNENHVACPNRAFSAFLEGLIIDRRGVNEKNPVPTLVGTALDNSDIFKKLRIALDLHAADIEELLEKGAADLANVDLPGIFRKKGHKHYKICPDSILEAFLRGVRLDKAEGTEDPDAASEPAED